MSQLLSSSSDSHRSRRSSISYDDVDASLSALDSSSSRHGVSSTSVLSVPLGSRSDHRNAFSMTAPSNNGHHHRTICSSTETYRRIDEDGAVYTPH